MNSAAQKELASAEYWDKRYSTEKESRPVGEDEESEYEWFKTFEKLKPFFQKHLPKPAEQPRILQLGCGTSSVTADFFNLGYTNQVSIDFSPIAIDTMKSRYHNLNLEWQVMDVRKMTFLDQEFDTAVDKGTVDAMLHGSLWDPEDDVRANVGAYVDEVQRILKPGGQWLYITYRQPHFLKPLLTRDTWDLHVETLEDMPGTFEYFAFVMTKRQDRV